MAKFTYNGNIYNFKFRKFEHNLIKRQRSTEMGSASACEVQGIEVIQLL